ncbi:MAG: CHASE2 domain-containing protein, partial [Cyanobacteria bacterium J06642_11]
MARCIVLTLLAKGEQGYPVSLTVRQLDLGGQAGEVTGQTVGQLPPMPAALIKALHDWQLPYRNLLEARASRILVKSESRFSWPEKAQELVEELNKWLNSASPSWQKVRDRILQTLGPAQETVFFVQTDDRLLQQLPWSAWNVLNGSTPATEVVFSPLNIHQRSQPKQRRQRLRMLAVLGDSDRIDLQVDRQQLSQSNADIRWLEQPDRQTFLEALWDQRGWDILYFGGHSGAGLIGLNQDTHLDPGRDFKHGIQQAIANGLQLAIFNSCDGLQLANDLTQLRLPRTIVMREPVPDEVAQDFLHFFLSSCDQETPLCTAVHRARQQLADAWNHKYPGIGWLPVIFQTPTTALALSAVAPSAVAPSAVAPSAVPQPSRRLRWWQIAVAGFLATSLVVGGRALGLLQPWELWWFDRLIQLRPAEPPDDRILIITVGESDIQYQRQQGLTGAGSLSDAALAQLLQKLAPHAPRVMGLDIYHDFDYEPTLAAQLAATPQFIAPCRVEGSNVAPTGIAGPPGFPPERLGFTDIPSDPSGAIRRQLIGMAADQTGCSTTYGLSSQVVMVYLGMEYVFEDHSSDTLTIGDTRLPRFTHTAGGYQLPPADANGYQILVNYRAEGPRQVSLESILRGDVDAQLEDWVSDRIVLIGLNKQEDAHRTPYSRGTYP